jgi:hypothetical protein
MPAQTYRNPTPSMFFAFIWFPSSSIMQLNGHQTQAQKVFLMLLKEPLQEPSSSSLTNFLHFVLLIFRSALL